ncbi:MAG: cyclic nucleotide-binding domain-containing protein [Actinomycetia bacterium]|nr:cyclic nucleotide-binding domain-containing protein [Actinomycetes bacterium]MCP4959727.1 cyclic nucleotide-binding domain-containing protein [Actinomycetes bacterium]
MSQKPDPLSLLPIFADLSKADLKKVARLMTETVIKEGKNLVTEGTVGREVFVVRDGRATVRKGSRVIASVGAGDVVGEGSLISGEPRSATVTADTEMTVEVLDRREFSSLLEEFPGIARKILAATMRHLHSVDPSVAH